MVASAVTAEGGQTEKSPDIESALNDPSPDAVIAIGGTGNGRNDASVAMLARIGTVAAHGIGLQPGETSAFGFVANRPVLLLPGRCDAALSAWLTLGRRLMALLTGRAEQSCSAAATLTRKITSTIGIAGQAEPLAQGYWPMNALTRANGWTVIPAGHEGLPAGATVQVNALT
jgi:molybdopterin biosynthesis enzyme